MSDDWRVHAELEDEIGAGHLLKGMHEREIAHEVQDHLDSRLPVTADAHHVFVYTADRAQAEAAAAAVAEVLTAHDLHGVVTIARWHPVEEAWKDPDEPLPATSEQQAAERAAREQREERESAERGPQWEVRIDLATHPAALAVADRLEAEGLSPLRRWKHVFISVASEDDAEELAERLRGEDLGAERILVEGTAADAWRATHPYAVLGGLAN
jgi:hypothetical protein